MKRVALAVMSLCVLVSFHSGAQAEMIVQTCFSPHGKCALHIVRAIESARTEVLVAVYAFTSDDLAGVLAQAKKRGVAVQVLIDREFDRANEHSKGKYLEAQKVAVRRISGLPVAGVEKDPGIMHQKFAVIDRLTVFTGSYNWTISAETRNDENLLMFRDAAPLAEEYRKTFLQMWERKS